MKKVLLLTTGGTIASQPGAEGLAPALSGQELLSSLGDLSGKYRVDVRQIMNLDSSAIQGAEWKIMARSVYESLSDYDGFIITHGTDTMAYSSSMLSFMLENVNKPVVFTGSQLPMEDPMTDARNNLFCALEAVSADIRGVSVAFDRHIIRGCRAVKVSSLGFDAFESVNARYLGELFADGLRVYDQGLPAAGKTPRLRDKISTDVVLFKLIPNLSPALFDCLPQIGCRGVVLETFGTGGFGGPALLDKFRMLRRKNIAVAVCSQCLYESSDLSIYQVGRELLETGVIPAGDMTTEAAVTKLMWALGQTEELGEVRDLFARDLAGEITLAENAP